MSVHEFSEDRHSRRNRIDIAIDAAADHLLSLQHDDGHWCGELEGDSILESEFLLLLYFLGRSDEERFRKGAEQLRRQQLPEGDGHCTRWVPPS